MVSDWQEFSLLDIYDVRSGLSKPAKDFGTGYPFLSFKDVFYNYFAPDVLSQLVQSSEKERIGCSVKRGDVFLTRTSETMHELGMSCVALKDYENATFNGFCKRLRPKKINAAFPEYVGYYLRSPKFRREMMSFSTMSTRASLNNEMIGRLKITLPSVNEQKSIAHILRTLDKKIELNQQANQTLEQMAQALFKSWFVDFDPVIDNALAAGSEIPDALQHRVEIRKRAYALQKQNPNIQPLPAATQRLFPSELEHTDEASIGINGWVPKGWQTKSVDECININPRVSLPKGTLAKFADMKALPTSGYGIMDVIEKNYTGGAKFQQGDVLLARITPCLQNGKTGIVDFMDEDNEIGFGSTEFIVMRRKGGLGTPFISCLARDENFRNHCMQSMVGSSGRQRVQNACFSAYFLALPTTENVLNTFQTIVAPMFTRMTINNEETKSLANLRDLLLPKLISGEIAT